MLLSAELSHWSWKAFANDYDIYLFLGICGINFPNLSVGIVNFIFSTYKIFPKNSTKATNNSFCIFLNPTLANWGSIVSYLLFANEESQWAMIKTALVQLFQRWYSHASREKLLFCLRLGVLSSPLFSGLCDFTEMCWIPTSLWEMFFYMRPMRKAVCSDAPIRRQAQSSNENLKKFYKHMRNEEMNKWM